MQAIIKNLALCSLKAGYPKCFYCFMLDYDNAAFYFIAKRSLEHLQGMIGRIFRSPEPRLR